MDNIYITMNENGDLTCFDPNGGYIEEMMARQMIISLNAFFKSSVITYFTISFQPYGLGKKIVTDNIYKDAQNQTIQYSQSHGTITCPIFDYVTVAPTVLMQIDGYEVDANDDICAIYKSGVIELNFNESIVGEKLLPDTTNADLKLSEKISDIVDDKLETAVLFSENIDDEAITTAKLADNCVETSKIKNGAVTSAKLANSAVTESSISNGAVSADKLADDAVESAKIKNNNVTSEKIAAGAVTTAKINDKAVTTDKINTGAVTDDRLASGAVTTAKIAGKAVLSGKIGDGQVKEINLENLSVTNSKIGTGAVTVSKISDSAVETSKIKDAAVTEAKLSSAVAAKLNSVPTKTSDLTNDSGFLTSHQSLANCVTLDTVQHLTAEKVWDYDGKTSLVIEPESGWGRAKVQINNPTATESTKYCFGKIINSGKTLTLPSSANATIATTADIPTSLSSLTDDLGSNPTHTHSQYLTQHQDVSGKADISDIPTKTSDLTNDSGFLTSVNTEDIASSAVTTAKIASKAVLSGKIGDGQVKEVNLENLSVTNSKIGTGAVTVSKISDDAVVTAKIKDGAVTEAKLSSAIVNKLNSIQTASNVSTAIANNQFVATYSKNANDQWECDKTFAEIEAAIVAKKEVKAVIATEIQTPAQATEKIYYALGNYTSSDSGSGVSFWRVDQTYLSEDFETNVIFHSHDATGDFITKTSYEYNFEPFTIHYTRNNDTFTADKTFAQLLAAYQSGRTIKNSTTVDLGGGMTGTVFLDFNTIIQAGGTIIGFAYQMTTVENGTTANGVTVMQLVHLMDDSCMVSVYNVPPQY